MPRAKPKHHIMPRFVKITLSLGCLFFVALILWASGSQATVLKNDKPLKVWVFDVGQGDALLIETPTGEQILIDGGRDDAILAKLGGVMLPWDRTLDAILLTHPDADHGTGLVSVLDQYIVETIYETGAMAHTDSNRAFVSSIIAEDAHHRLIQFGDVIEFGEVILEVLSPDKIYADAYPSNRNDTSLVIKVIYGDTTMLLMGDAEAEVEASLQRSAGDIDILKVGHHGSLSSSTWEFLQSTHPEVAIISAGEDNQYGHPHPIVLSRLEELGVPVLRTDKDGDILITSWGDEPMLTPAPLPF
jgi:competence protein ComEC